MMQSMRMVRVSSPRRFSLADTSVFTISRTCESVVSEASP